MLRVPVALVQLQYRVLEPGWQVCFSILGLAVSEDGVFYLFGGTDGAARQSDVHACPGPCPFVFCCSDLVGKKIPR